MVHSNRSKDTTTIAVRSPRLLRGNSRKVFAGRSHASSFSCDLCARTPPLPRRNRLFTRIPRVTCAPADRRFSQLSDRSQFSRKFPLSTGTAWRDWQGSIAASFFRMESARGIEDSGKTRERGIMQSDAATVASVRRALRRRRR